MLTGGGKCVVMWAIFCPLFGKTTWFDAWIGGEGFDSLETGEEATDECAEDEELVLL